MRSIVRYLSVFLLITLPLSLFAETASLSSEDTLKQLIFLVSQYESRIKSLESENALLKNEMMKAGIKIPLIQFTGALIQDTPSSAIPAVYLTGILTPVIPPVSVTEATQAQLTSQYGKDISGFITRIEREWRDIRHAYSLPENAQIGGYEFVQSGVMDHVFVDIVFGTGSAGIYDAKILYQFEKKEYKRKLIGFFEYSPATTRYTTRSGANPFPGVARSFIRDPYFAGQLTAPSTATANPSIPVISGEVSSGTIQPIVVSSTTVAFADVEKAYSEKRYLSVIALSSTYLSTNTPTYDILRIRYRTYFIIGKYTESLTEIAKIQSLGKLDKQTACDAQVIATYSKDTSLVTKYSTLCAAK